MDFHINQFGNDIDNLGFYLKEGQLVGVLSIQLIYLLILIFSGFITRKSN